MIATATRLPLCPRAWTAATLCSVSTSAWVPTAGSVAADHRERCDFRVTEYRISVDVALGDHLVGHVGADDELFRYVGQHRFKFGGGFG
jgi:hypothetical protein